MNSPDLIKMSLKNLFRRKVRTFLTILGVIIGTAAIVVMLSLGIGMNESFNRELKRMGSLNMIDVDAYYMPEGDGPMRGPGVKAKLDDKAIAAISQIEGVEAVSPLMNTGMKFICGKYVAYVSVVGVDPQAMASLEFKTSEGRLLQKDDTNAVVFGSFIPQNFYNPKARGRFYGYGMGDGKPVVDVMNDRIEMTFDMSYGEKLPPGVSGQQNNKPAKIYKVQSVGVLAEGRDEKDYSVYMNINYLKKLMREESRRQSSNGGRGNRFSQDTYDRVKVKVSNIKDVEQVQKKINEMGFGAYSLADLRKSMQKQANTIQTILGGIGAISLLIAALGITNTMVMSIYERTREIGIMKVLGCVLGDIRRVFLLEAGMIGFLGGVLGVVLSLGASFLLNKIGGNFMNSMGGMMGPEQNKISLIPLWLCGASIGFATVIGLISGFYPARRAMKLSALEAIKTE